MIRARLAALASLLPLTGACAQMTLDGGFAAPSGFPTPTSTGVGPTPSSTPGGGPSIALVQTSSFSPDGVFSNDTSVTLPLPVAAGDLILVVAAQADETLTAAVNDSAGNSYAPASNPFDGSHERVSVFFAYAGSGGSSLTVHVHLSGVTANSLLAAEFSGVAASQQGNEVSSSSGSGASLQAGPPGGILPGDLLVGAETHDPSAVSTTGGGFAKLAIVGETSGISPIPLGAEWQLAPAAPTSADFRLSASDSWAACAVAFHPG